MLVVRDQAFAATTTNNNSILPGIHLNIGSSTGPTGVDGTIQIILLLTVLSIAPAILVLMTAFTRVIVVLGFVRNALSLQNTPPNQVLIGLALFITLFIMQPVLSQANTDALQPYLKGDISQTIALQKAELPFKEFMGKETRTDDIEIFLNYRHEKMPAKVQDLPMSILVPAYTISELKTGFQIGFMIYIPFLLIDLIVSTTLMSMGMMMLPPTMISLPFKILLFILVDGWNLIIQSILSGYAH
ncbi:flagellar type III secretion system pore protein FliP [Alicyclobacillus ferrooxydans]|uniref:Flagellar biosynthetic protein FliP n=1 Tax=Alicyclobacillus ferrooxydans TaxID=471514 RepID=A0A0P9EM41_9BACL|nr:flagellar type III secretion system pore protein FliP [Alicyclobacillus ferrooxydans]KPV44402.1 flagellar biosynthesis protein flip [Alicyclobacillus ferrooxydans]